ncbi:conserved unknown protein [Ectocarpus siliculosus]|uniref:EF-hand domain-containing protein n=1 Tax=Ectocarpus siliculosus TaxID=2880 RepID=D8LDM0_ECTSI|nr:conserved unknown protein [Ectocarpus siliculosus]|eukprot:CBN74096.1 conserved unknown protein [Ectocarpus siliculosus]
MSTQLSGDLVWEKSSTRRYAPPGGQTSISLGDYATETPAAANGAASKAKAQMASPPRAPTPTRAKSATPTASPPAELAVSAAGLHVGVAVCESEALKSSTVAALQQLGAKTTIYEVSDPLQLPFAIQCMVQKTGVSVVVAIGFLVADAHWCSKEVGGALVKTLLELSLSLKVPVVNGLCFRAVSEGDAAALSGKLAKGAIHMSSVRDGKQETYTVSRAIPAVGNSGDLFASNSRGLSLGPKRRSSVFGQTRAVPTDLTSLLLGLKTSLKAHGATGMFGLARRFRLSDDDKSGTISFHEFQVCMRDAHMGWTEDELKNVFEHFDTDGSDTIDYDEFLFAVRGELNERRAQVILEAFEVMDKDKNGALNASDLKGVYDASQHPGVVAKRRTEEEVMEEFISSFEGEIKDGKVTPEEWCRYYSMLSAGMPNDDDFELMMRNAWHLPGGVGAMASTTGRRVLATRADGSQTIEEVKGAAGMGNSDKKAMLNSLRSQGLNVTSVALFGSVDSTEPPAANAVDMAETMSVGGQSNEGSTYSAPIRQGPGGNSSLVLG